MDNIGIYINLNRTKRKIIIKKNEKVCTIKNIIIKEFNLNIPFSITHNNRILYSNSKINFRNNDCLDINITLRGGIVLGVIKSIFSILNPIAGPFSLILNAVIKMFVLLGEFMKLFPNLIELAINIFNPDKLINDVLYGVTHGITSMFGAIVGKMDIGGGDVDKEKDGGPFGVTEKKQAVCIPPTLMNLFILVLCPPLALFLNRGIGGWFITIVCALMTYFMYYFPGFIFAALHILC